jgi:hypothetical protein
MRRLLGFTCLTPLALAAPALAETSISTRVTAPVRTATAANGAPDSIKITSAGAVAPTGGAAVTIDTSHGVINEGGIEVRGANGAIGILVNPGLAANITSSGKITIDEDYTPADADKDGDLDGPFAQGSNRYGIRLAPGGTFTGNVANSGTILVEGNSSAGIAADARLAGSLTHSGAVTVLGNDSVGIRTGEVTGNVTVSGAVEARGANSIGVSIGGDVGGRVTVQAPVVASGYRSLTRPADVTKLDADDLLQGGPALRIAGNVAGGVLLDAPPADTKPDDKDEDKDGIEDAKEGTAQIASYGAAPAVLVGAADRAVAIGAVPGDANGHGIVIRGTVLADGVYKGVSATALQIGGAGGAVTVSGGVSTTNAIRATSLGANATAVRVGAAATVPELRNSGTIAADGSSTAGTSSRAVSIDAGASLPALRNTGTLDAKASGAGTAATVVDASGSLALIENSGAITASGAGAAERNIAIDLRANTSGAIVRQNAPATASASASRIAGAVLFGAGGDLLEVNAGSVTGNADFGAGDNRLALANAATFTGNASFGAGADRITLGGTSQLSGDLNFGGGGDQLTLANTARFRGALSNAGGLALTVNGGRAELTNIGAVSIGSLSVAQGGVLGVTINGATGQSTLLTVAGTASFAQGSELAVRLTDLAKAEGRFTVLRAGTLTGAPALSVNNTTLPFMFKGAIASGTPAGEIAVDIARKTATELNLNRSEAAIYNAAYGAMLADADVGGVFLGLNSEGGFKSSLRQLMPDHAGGVFDAVTQGSRSTARFLLDPTAPFDDHGRWGWFLQQVAWGNSKPIGDTARFKTTGWGVSGGAELITGMGSFGVSLAFLDSDVKDGERRNLVDLQQYELGGYWRLNAGAFRAFARASAALLDIDSRRAFDGDANGKAVQRAATASRDGRLYSAALGGSYELQLGRFSIRPAASLDWYKLTESGYTEQGGGKGVNLILKRRSSDELAANGTATFAYEFGDRRDGWFRVELEGGRRQILAGELGDTVAHFDGGNAFSLTSEERDSGWLGRLRLVGGNPGFTLGGEASAEEQYGRAALAFRLSLQVGL